ncbi:MAG: hypothetical protein AB7R89_01020 [Dehalococcoidia bacterium]
MSRRNLDIIIATGGALFAILIAALGLVAWNEADFAKDNVHDQLSAQQIFFKDEADLTPSERELPGVVETSGEQLTTGDQAQAYAGVIGLHLQEQAAKAGYPGATYASIGTVQTQLRTQVTEAKAAGDPNAAELEKQHAAVTTLRDSQFRGETLRGLLLTTYGFSVLGERAALAANIAFGIAAVAAVLSVAGFLHAFATPKEQRVLGGVLVPVPTK